MAIPIKLRTLVAGMVPLLCCVTLLFSSENLPKEGAPPSIPHEVRTDLSCIDCHQINKNPGVQHLARNNCLQCHVVSKTEIENSKLNLDLLKFATEWVTKPLPRPESKIHLSQTFAGAPPAIPHSTKWTQNCLECHSSSIDNAFLTSHADRQNCTQCHVSIATIEGSPFTVSADATFDVEWFSPLMEAKANRHNHSKAPTMIPHAINSRENCMDCHSPEATNRMRTTHPERKNCMQCHVPSAFINERELADAK
ncbi:MAG: hypothetical protein MI748_08405 [Opitutales bacterium]|nr:hypothetical protein [Opitutales bacterium]